MLFVPFACQAKDGLKTDCLCVLYDAGETNSLLFVLQEWEREGRNFRVLVMGTAEKLVPPGMFGTKRLTLQDFGIEKIIDSQTARKVALPNESIELLDKIVPTTVLSGTASKIQEQILTFFRDSSSTFAFLDNFNYDTNSQFYKTVVKAQAAAKVVLCPSDEVLKTFFQDTKNESRIPKYVVVGKPTLDSWEKEISLVKKDEVLRKLNLKHNGGPVVTFVGGYGEGYDVINPLFDECAEKLRAKGYQVIMQPHPKIAPQVVKITEALAVSDYVVGFNSSVIFEAALVGKNAVFMIPKRTSYQHFALKNGYMASVSSYDELLSYIRDRKAPQNIRHSMAIPRDSVQRIRRAIESEWRSLPSGVKFCGQDSLEQFSLEFSAVQ